MWTKHASPAQINNFAMWTKHIRWTASNINNMQASQVMRVTDAEAEPPKVTDAEAAAQFGCGIDDKDMRSIIVRSFVTAMHFRL